MTNREAKEWANLIQKLGLPFKKTEVIRFAVGRSYQDVWNEFIASNPLHLKVAEFNHLNSTLDVLGYFNAIRYAHMRSTFPPKARGRSIIGPGIISLQRMLEEEKQEEERLKRYREPLRKNTDGKNEGNIHNMIGKKIVHTSIYGVSYGIGIVKAIKGDLMTVEFENCGKKVLSYSVCVQRKLIEIL